MTRDLHHDAITLLTHELARTGCPTPPATAAALLAVLTGHHIGLVDHTAAHERSHWRARPHTSPPTADYRAARAALTPPGVTP